MNLYHLRYFVTLAEIEHYTKAADMLAITQPTLSHAIYAMEEEERGRSTLRFCARSARMWFQS